MELAAQSENGFDFIPTPPPTGSFREPQWLEDRKRYELPEEFNRRLQDEGDPGEKRDRCQPHRFLFPVRRLRAV